MSPTWQRFMRRRRNWLGVAVALALASTGLLADFIASDRPVVLRAGGAWYLFPNLIEYRALRAFDPGRMGPDDWALWTPLRHGPYAIPQLSRQREPLPEPPSSRHWLGTDNAGRDTAARLVHGIRASLGMAIAAAGLQIVLGLLLGVLAGYLGGFVDLCVTKATEVLLSFPLLLLLLAVQGVLERTTLLSTVAVIGLTRWADASRLVRAEALRVRELAYVEASRALGSSQLRTLFVHVLPNCLSPALVAATFAIGSTILIESALSFLGFGAPEPTASWGLLMADGFKDVLDPAAWPLLVLPGLAIFVSVSAFNAIGEGLRDALDPRAQGSEASSALRTSAQKRALSPAPIPEGGEPMPAKYGVPVLK